jgi:hypothetical protein
MPTGYTSFIENGKVKTAKQFLHLCLRAFGVCINMRDDGLEVKDDYTKDLLKGFQQDIDYHKKLLKIAEKKLSEIKSISEEELCEKYIKETKEKIKDLQKGQTDVFNKYGDYLRIRESIKNWDCNPEFQGVKDFALEQIRISIPSGSYYEEELSKMGKPTKEGFQEKKEEYLQKLIDDAQWDVNYHTEELEKAIQHRDDKLKFYNEFKEDLNKLK